MGSNARPRGPAPARSVRILQASKADEIREDETAVVVDVLRASTTIAVALHQGARLVLPVETPEEALEVSRQFDEPVLVGERDRGSLDGFVDNSPARVARLDLEGRAVVLTTTNGTRAVLAAKGAHRVLAGALTNASALRGAVEREDVVLVAAGWRGRAAEDDDVCCAYLAELFKGGQPDVEATLEALEASTSARKLREAGKGDDVDVCLSLDRCPVVPQLEGRALEPIEPSA